MWAHGGCGAEGWMSNDVTQEVRLNVRWGCHIVQWGDRAAEDSSDRCDVTWYNKGAGEGIA